MRLFRGPGSNKPPLGTNINRAHALSQGLIGAWLFNEGAGNTLTDATGNNNEMVGVNNPTWKSGRKSTAGQTDGSTQYWTNSSIQLPTTATTVVLIAMTPFSSGQGSIIGNPQLDNTGNTRDFNIHFPFSGVIYWDFGNGGSGNRISYSPSAGFFGTWHHMVFTAGPSGSAIYEDGVLKVSQPTAITRTSLNTGLQIGRRATFYQQATIEQVLIYNRVLTSAEMNLLLTDNYAFMSAPRIRGLSSILAAAAAQSILPSGIASLEAWGSAVVSAGAVSVMTLGISSAEAWGASSLSPGGVSLAPSGIASLEAFGQPVVVPGPVTILPSGVLSAEQWGAVIVAAGGLTIAPGGIVSAETFGQPVIVPGPVTIAPAGIGSGEAWGSPLIAPGGVVIFPAGIATAERWGLPSLGNGMTVIIKLPTTVRFANNGKTKVIIN